MPLRGDFLPPSCLLPQRRPQAEALSAGPVSTLTRLPCSALQVRYKEEFEKNKGKGFSVVADTPELQRIKKTQDQISNVRSPARHGAHADPPPSLLAPSLPAWQA